MLQTCTHRFLIAIIGSVFLANFAYADGWQFTGALQTPRSNFEAIVLSNGKVLAISGADADDHATPTCELFDPTTMSWSYTGSLVKARSRFQAILLTTGEVLVVGGRQTSGLATASCELYDPNTGTWRLTGRMYEFRDNHRACLLADGKVLVTGGTSFVPQFVMKSAEIYDRATETWTQTKDMGSARFNHSQTLLADGKVLVVGGSGNGGDRNSVPLSELYDPMTNQWSKVSPIKEPTQLHEAVTLGDGSVLVCGGWTLPANAPHASASTYLYTQSYALERVSDMLEGRSAFRAILMQDGSVLAAGGLNSSDDSLSSVERFSPESKIWSAAAGLNMGRYAFAVAKLADGRVLAIGGLHGSNYVNSVEVYDPSTP